MKIGIAMSTYNRPGDAAWNVDLIRNKWPETRHNYHIILCYNNPKMKGEFEALKGIDTLVEGLDLPATNKPEIRCRQVNCWQTGIRAGLMAKCDYVIHFHADAYVLHPSWLEGQIDRMAAAGTAAAGRGYGLDHRAAKVPEGDIDDHFFIVGQSIGDSFFEPPGPMTMNVYASEGYLATRMRFGAGESFEHYDDLSHNEHGSKPRGMHPFNYDPKRFLLHTPDEALREDYLQRALQSATNNTTVIG